MKKSYARSLKAYDGPFELDAAKILEAMMRHSHAKKRPTSVALDEGTIRVFILDGLNRLKTAA